MTKTKTSHGYRILAGVTYRYTEVSGFVHVDEYVPRFGVWVYMGYLV